VVQAEGLFEGERALDLFEELAVLDAAGLAIEAVPVAGAVVPVLGHRTSVATREGGMSSSAQAAA
jgi:hypothetical protein